MALIPTVAHLAVVTAGIGYSFSRLEIGEGNRAPPADPANGWDVTALLAPFNPVREIVDPPGGASGAVHVVDWQDGAEGDAVGYLVNEIGLSATPTGGAEYLAFYESQAAGSIFEKTAGSVILRRLRLAATGAQLANATFNVDLTAPAASETLAGVSRRATNAEADATEANAIDTATLSPLKWWRMFTGARIVARLAAQAGANRLSYNSLKDTPAAVNLSAYAPLAGPVFTGNPQAPTPSSSDGDTSLATTAFVKNQGYGPAEPWGMPKMWLSDAAPAGHTLLDGGNLSRAAYPNLFAEWGERFGAGNGATTFGKPDMRGRVPVGAGGVDDALLGNDVGDTGGERSHTLIVDEMPAHDHFLRFRALRTVEEASGSLIQEAEINGDNFRNVSSTGGGQPHNNIQPSFVVNFITRLG